MYFFVNNLRRETPIEYCHENVQLTLEDLTKRVFVDVAPAATERRGDWKSKLEEIILEHMIKEEVIIEKD